MFVITTSTNFSNLRDTTGWLASYRNGERDRKARGGSSKKGKERERERERDWEKFQNRGEERKRHLPTNLSSLVCLSAISSGKLITRDVFRTGKRDRSNACRVETVCIPIYLYGGIFCQWTMRSLLWKRLVFAICSTTFGIYLRYWISQKIMHGTVRIT